MLLLQLVQGARGLSLELLLRRRLVLGTRRRVSENWQKGLAEGTREAGMSLTLVFSLLRLVC